MGLHRHAAAAVLLGLDGAFGIRASTSSRWLRSTEVFVPAGCAHELDCGDTWMRVLYLAPGQEEAARFCRRWAVTGTGILPLPPQTAAREWGCYLLSAEVSEPQLRAELEHWVGEVKRESPLRDARVRRVLSALEADPTTVHVAQLAQRFGVSPSRLRHIVQETMGISVRDLRRWQRMREVGRLLARGLTLTSAAHELAFNDSAHFCRDFRGSFGVAPSRVFHAGCRIVVADAEPRVL